jgi:hypothetical protein
MLIHPSGLWFEPKLNQCLFKQVNATEILPQDETDRWVITLSLRDFSHFGENVADLSFLNFQKYDRSCSTICLY